jgi:hypothetical protein
MADIPADDGVRADDYPIRVRITCEAYEAGFGDGLRGVSKKNPYEPWTDGWFAWSYGVRRGMSKSRSIASATKELRS